MTLHIPSPCVWSKLPAKLRADMGSAKPVKGPQVALVLLVGRTEIVVEVRPAEAPEDTANLIERAKLVERALRGVAFDADAQIVSLTVVVQ